MIIKLRRWTQIIVKSSIEISFFSSRRRRHSVTRSTVHTIKRYYFPNSYMLETCMSWKNCTLTEKIVRLTRLYTKVPKLSPTWPKKIVFNARRHPARSANLKIVPIWSETIIEGRYVNNMNFFYLFHFSCRCLVNTDTGKSSSVIHPLYRF